MKKYILLLIIPFLFTCGDKNSEKRVLDYNLINMNSPSESPLMYYEGELFSGVGYSLYENGQLAGEQTYKFGKLNGPVKLWWNNGQINMSSHYTNGFPTHLSTEKLWYETGELFSEGTFENPHGDLTFGGVWSFYYKNGKLERKEIWEDGKKKSQICWDNMQKEVECNWY